MRTLEEEALEYTVSNGGNKPETFTDEQIGRLHGYIDGANSKWVQAEKIKAQIEVLEDVIWIETRLEMLKQQLKRLEDGE